MLPDFFHDSNGGIVWSAVSATVSAISAALVFVGVIMNICTQRKIAKQQIDANLKAKARIEWITEVRNLVSRYISYLFDIKITVSRMYDMQKEIHDLSRDLSQVENKDEIYNRKDNLKKQLLKREDELMISIQESILTGEKILLHFSKKDDHDSVENAILESIAIIKDIESKDARLGFYNPYLFESSRNYADEKRSSIDSSIQTIREIFREYLKNEWDKAKQGK
ncbi:hypothetical protein E5936_002072 [Enterococcus faecium]|uniref:hypothetical protein n=1 Tax=Enterococcus TaxID=1350 RepID=UPI0019F97F78|nr:hypothetical protein [Enterococcus lactis]EGP5006240.1 hypothetical protein [Enterococcus faecium]EME8167562.1 hypothetical protein [Enterococcus faecium]MDB7103920.1 hypothetical protein [Enterococcus faecium]MDB7250597.1 hypothetical protein [Enterococcus faecium]MDB7260837.1 hypothetical protein [Enterococcus faecium]